MGRRYDIFQTPKGINQKDLPKKMDIGVPFQINGETYVCEKVDQNNFRIYNNEEDRGSNKHYYVVRKL
ncbi:uncharacterized protein VNE69_05107 [Vairimorpha necatrix]|uniref:Uncharacterized protein n=1 Tax=Vairimorpha necatrix TaxID=6039 RepID=A0AAX4JC29_9MICR